MHDKIVILGVPVHAITKTAAVDQLMAWLKSEGRHHVMTPNNEMLVEATKNREFFDVLSRSDLNLADSTGLLFAARITGSSLPERVTGVDTVTALLSRLEESTPIFLLGAKEGVAARAAEEMIKKNPKLTVVGTVAGSPRDEDAQTIVDAINRAAPQLLLVAYGAPAQDLWIARNLKSIPSVRVAMGVGGTLDFLAGTKKRAPGWMRRLGIEWLFRFIKEPSRWKRMANAVIVFPLLVLRYGKRSPLRPTPQP
jgi:N-acetylglucosaminyldiphosphoundecaprenol N-acetyl-beta-D-mannosaminyltransferase